MSVEGTRKVQYGRDGGVRERSSALTVKSDQPGRQGNWAVKYECLYLQTLIWAENKVWGCLSYKVILEEESIKEERKKQAKTRRLMVPQGQRKKRNSWNMHLCMSTPGPTRCRVLGAPPTHSAVRGACAEHHSLSPMQAANTLWARNPQSLSLFMKYPHSRIQGKRE